MDLHYSEADQSFRKEIRVWLDATIESYGPPPPPGDWAARRDYDTGWQRRLYDAGYAGLNWPVEFGGRGLPASQQLVYFEEYAASGAPYVGINFVGNAHAGPTLIAEGTHEQRAFHLPRILKGELVWCQGFSEPEAGSDLASLRTRAVRDGSEYVITGHKLWTSYSDQADWCLVLARTDPDAPKHRGISAFVVPMRQPAIEQRPLKMINGITREFGEVIFDGARVDAANMIGEPGEGWRLAMTIVSHEREPGELGYVGRYGKLVKELAQIVRGRPADFGAEQRRDLAWAMVEAEMLRCHVSRRLSDRLDGITHGPEGSVDKLLMTWTEQSVGHAALAVGGIAPAAVQDDTWLRVYLYSRAQSVMGGTSQIQRNLIASRILEMPSS